MAGRNARYRVTKQQDGWSIEHDGRAEGDYSTKEAAFEAIVGAASNSIKDGYGVVIEIPASDAAEPALGAK